MVLGDPNSFRNGREFESIYDLFKRRADGFPFWITTVDSLEEARERTSQCASVVLGDYFIYLQGEGIILEYITLEKKDRRVPRPI
jgi:hypothetical protein